MIAGFDAVKEVKRAQRIMGVVADDEVISHSEMNSSDNLSFLRPFVRDASGTGAAGELASSREFSRLMRKTGRLEPIPKECGGNCDCSPLIFQPRFCFG